MPSDRERRSAMYDKEQRANNISLLYMLLQKLNPDDEISLQQVISDYDRLLDEVMHMLEN